MHKKIYMMMLLTAPIGIMRADFRYDQTTRITGGAIVGMMKFAGTFSKDARKATDPTESTTAVKGNRMVHKTGDTEQIIDIDRETITRVHFGERTYSVITFEQMKQAMEDMAKKMQSKDANAPDMQFDVAVKDTGQTRMLGGASTHEVILTMTAKTSDPKSGARGGLDMSTDMWIAPSVAGYGEVRAFYRRMAERMNWMPGASPLMGRADISRAMSEMYKEGAKLDGIPMLEVIRMGGSAEGMPQSTEAQPRRQSAPPPASVGDAVGGALAGRLGIGGFGRKKKQEQAPVEDTNQGSASTGSAAGSLLEMTMETTSYSANPVDAAMFEVPAGFSKVEEEAIPQGRGRRK